MSGPTQANCRQTGLAVIYIIIEEDSGGISSHRVAVMIHSATATVGPTEQRYPARFAARAIVPREVFSGEAEFDIGGPQFAISERGDNIFDAEWFKPAVDISEVRAFLRKSRPAAKASEETAAVSLLAEVLRENHNLTKRDAFARLVTATGVETAGLSRPGLAVGARARRIDAGGAAWCQAEIVALSRCATIAPVRN